MWMYHAVYNMTSTYQCTPVNLSYQVFDSRLLSLAVQDGPVSSCQEVTGHCLLEGSAQVLTVG